MGKFHWKSLGLGGVCLLALIFAFQNCAPAKLNTGSTSLSEDGSSEEPSTIPDTADSGTVNPTPTPAMTPTPPPSRIARVRTRVNNSSMMDAPNGNLGTRVHLWEAADTPNQIFEFTQAGEIKAHGSCLMPNGNGAGAAVVLATCSGADIQKWMVDVTSGEIKSTNGLCLDLANSMTANRTAISVWTCHREINQRWDLVLP